MTSVKKTIDLFFSPNTVLGMLGNFYVQFLNYWVVLGEGQH